MLLFGNNLFQVNITFRYSMWVSNNQHFNALHHIDKQEKTEERNSSGQEKRKQKEEKEDKYYEYSR